jgi:protein-serine/threonine kinase
MILCVEEAHKMNWIHRDVKPNNFLISASGHLKISDFGLAFDGHWAHAQAYHQEQRNSMVSQFHIQIRGDSMDEKHDEEKRRRFGRTEQDRARCDLEPCLEHDTRECPSKLEYLHETRSRRLARSIVGTSQYMAPEVINGDNYDGRCDWWSIGIILYEASLSQQDLYRRINIPQCFYGYTPFYHKDREITKYRIMVSVRPMLLGNSVLILETQHHRAFLDFPQDVRLVRSREHETNFLLPAASRTAINLMSNLLRDKDRRLSSSCYSDSSSPPSPCGYSCTNPYQESAPYFVFPNDAADIKTHPFFDGIEWERLHFTLPPWVPNVKDDIAKYFDPEESFLSSQDSFDKNSESDIGVFILLWSSSFYQN